MIDDDSATAGMLRFECGWCGALAGMWCYRPNGKRATYLHSARFYQWREAASNDHQSQ
jgi:hypothetical protein